MGLLLAVGRHWAQAIAVSGGPIPCEAALSPPHSPTPTPHVCCSMLPTVSQVAATLHFNPSLEYLAERVVSYITRDGRRRFNGAPRGRGARR